MAGQSIASLPSSCRNCHPTLHRGDPGANCTSMWSHKASWFRCRAPKYDSLTANLAKQDDVAGSGTFSTDAPDSATSVICAPSEPAIICEVHKRQAANLPFLDVLWLLLQCWAVSTVPLIESVPGGLSRKMHISGLLPLIVQDPGSAPTPLALRRR